MVSHDSGELDELCYRSLSKARSLGFRGVALSPTFYFSTKQQKIYSPKKGVRSGEISRCLDIALHQGFQIYYKPHINAPTFEPWRAYFEVIPDQTFLHAVYGEFWSWIKKNSAKIKKLSRPVHVLMATELETSVIRYPQYWLMAVKQNKMKVKQLGLDSIVSIGWVPNWGALENLKLKNCSIYSQIFNHVDYVSPTLYGDWRRGIKYPILKTKLIALRKNFLNRYSCKLNPRLPSLQSIGIAEFAVGLKMAAIHDYSKNDKLAFEKLSRQKKQTFLKQRRKIYENFFNDLNGVKFHAKNMPVILWTVGFFDPFGVSFPLDESMADSAIQLQLFRAAAR